ncbi:MAG: hypothetical protein ACHP7D_01985 [Lysobacterales bacterium]
MPEWMGRQPQIADGVERENPDAIFQTRVARRVRFDQRVLALSIPESVIGEALAQEISSPTTCSNGNIRSVSMPSWYTEGEGGQDVDPDRFGDARGRSRVGLKKYFSTVLTLSGGIRRSCDAPAKLVAKTQKRNIPAFRSVLACIS